MPFPTLYDGTSAGFFKPAFTLPAGDELAGGLAKRAPCGRSPCKQVKFAGYRLVDTQCLRYPLTRSL